MATVIPPDSVGEEQQADGQEMVQHENSEVFADGLHVDGGVDTVDVEANLEDIQPVQYRVHWVARVPCCVCRGRGEGERIVFSYWYNESTEVHNPRRDYCAILNTSREMYN